MRKQHARNPIFGVIVTTLEYRYVAQCGRVVSGHSITKFADRIDCKDCLKKVIGK